ncbi:MAG TPA: nucleotidyltransferase domain-containing protein [Spirochaetota bacterium]|nr:nucleotidyltransferase domain-containing protein [Spirochaetota bacterium]HQL43780.1 nucleotidyltransferase domain-containing protein [Spirochaetota bacterium]
MQEGFNEKNILYKSTNELSKHQLINFLKSNKEYYKNKYGITRIGLFGSFAKNQNTKKSDIDLIIIMSQDKKNIHNFLAFKNELELILKRKVDVGFEHTIKKSVKDEILKDIIYV